MQRNVGVAAVDFKLRLPLIELLVERSRHTVAGPGLGKVCPGAERYSVRDVLLSLVFSHQPLGVGDVKHRRASEIDVVGLGTREVGIDYHLHAKGAVAIRTERLFVNARLETGSGNCRAGHKGQVFYD